MATSIESRPTKPETGTGSLGDQCIVMPGVSWAGYEEVLRLRGARRRPRILYLDGGLSFTSPAYAHEMLAMRLADLVKAVASGLERPYKVSRSTTFKRERDQAGAKADDSFYLASADRILGRREIDLRDAPPPDLAIEAVNTHGATEAVEVWRRFGVPEVWVAELERLPILALQADGRYAEQPTSVAFPFLSAAEIHRQATQDLEGLDSDWIAELRRWVAGPLAERARAGQAPPPPGT